MLYEAVEWNGIDFWYSLRCGCRLKPCCVGFSVFASTSVGWSFCFPAFVCISVVSRISSGRWMVLAAFLQYEVPGGYRYEGSM